MEAKKKIPRKRWMTDWWPNRLNLKVLRQHCPNSNPYGPDFDYIKECRELDLAAVKKDLRDIMRQSSDLWPADFGNYGSLFIRLAWHSAGGYRVYDGGEVQGRAISASPRESIGRTISIWTRLSGCFGP